METKRKKRIALLLFIPPIVFGGAVIMSVFIGDVLHPMAPYYLMAGILIVVSLTIFLISILEKPERKHE